MFTDFQMDIGVFLKIFANNLLKRRICVDYSATIELLDDTPTVYVADHVEFTEHYVTNKDHTFTLEIGGTKTFPGTAPLITQQVCVHFVTQDDLLANGVNGSPWRLKIFFNVNVLLTLAIDSNHNCSAQFSFDSVDFEFANPTDTKYLMTYALTNAQRNAISDVVAGNFSTYSALIDFSSVNTVVSGMKLVNRNAAVVSNGTTLFYRIEYELRDIQLGDVVNPSFNSIAKWEAFLGGQVSSQRGDRTWAIIYDKDFLEIAVWEETRASFKRMADKFQADPVITVNWKFDGTPGLNIHFSGSVLRACNCLGSDMDVDIDASTTIEISVPSPDKIATTLSTSVQPNQFELFCCAVTMQLFWPVLSGMYLEQGSIDSQGVLLGWLTWPIFGPLIGVMVAGNTQSTTGQVRGNGNCVKIDDNTIECTRTVRPSFSDRGVHVSLVAVSGIAEGLVLTGDMVCDPVVASTPGISIHPINWALGGNCTFGVGLEHEGKVVIGPNSGNTGLGFIMPPRVIGDELNVFGRITYQYDGPSNSYSISVNPEQNQQYFTNPYPCRLKIITSGGVRIVSLGNGLPALDDAADRVSEARRRMEPRCNLVFQFPFNFELEWVDKRPWVWESTEQISHHLWQIVLTNIEAAENVELIDYHGRSHATARGPAQNIRLEAFLAVDKTPQAKQALTLRFSGSRNSRANGAAHQIAVKQIPLIERSVIPFAAEVIDLQLLKSAREELVRVVCKDQLLIYGLANLRSPRLIAIEKTSAAAGAAEKRPQGCLTRLLGWDLSKTADKPLNIDPSVRKRGTYVTYSSTRNELTIYEAGSATSL